MSVSYNFTALSMPKETAVLINQIPKVETQDNYSNQSLDSIWQPPKFNFTA